MHLKVCPNIMPIAIFNKKKSLHAAPKKVLREDGLVNMGFYAYHAIYSYGLLCVTVHVGVRILAGCNAQM